MIIDIHNAVRSAYPSTVTVIGNDIDSLEAKDVNGNLISIESSIVTAKLSELQAAEAQAQQAQIEAKQTALNKLMALGLTEEEALALGK